MGINQTLKRPGSNFSTAKGTVILACLLLGLAIFAGIVDFKNKQVVTPLPEVDLSQSDFSNRSLNITGNHLFGRTDNTPVVTEAPEVEPSQQAEPINIEVMGILASTDERYARASLKLGNKKEKSYIVGDKLTATDRVILAAITPDGILVDNNGETQEFLIKKIPLQSNQQLAGQTNQQSQFNNSNLTKSPPPGEIPGHEIFDPMSQSNFSSDASFTENPELINNGEVNPLPEEFLEPNNGRFEGGTVGLPDGIQFGQEDLQELEDFPQDFLEEIEQEFIDNQDFEDLEEIENLEEIQNIEQIPGFRPN